MYEGPRRSVPRIAPGAIARSRQIAGVGDTKSNCRPRPFSTAGFPRWRHCRKDDDQNEHRFGPSGWRHELRESGSTLCDARGPRRADCSNGKLTASRPPSLIGESRTNGSLQQRPHPFPRHRRADRESDGADHAPRFRCLRLVGGKRTNRIGGRAIAAAVAEHARQVGRSQRWDVVTFSTAQRDLSTETHGDLPPPKMTSSTSSLREGTAGANLR